MGAYCTTSLETLYSTLQPRLRIVYSKTTEGDLFPSNNWHLWDKSRAVEADFRELSNVELVNICQGRYGSNTKKQRAGSEFWFCEAMINAGEICCTGSIKFGQQCCLSASVYDENVATGD